MKLRYRLCLYVFLCYVSPTSVVYSQTPGTQRWAFAAGDDISASPAIGPDGTIYIGSGDKKLYAINADGTQKWSFTAGGYVFSSPAIGSDGTIYVGSTDYKLYAINSVGVQKWSIRTGNWIVSSPAIGFDGTIYVGSQDNILYAISANGTQKWAYATNGAITSSPAIGSDGTVYVGSGDKKLYALSPDGTLKWTFTTGDYVSVSPAIGSNGIVYAGSQDKKLYAINPNGTQKWAFTAGSAITSSPAIGSDGTIYFGCEDHKLYAINAGGTQKWTFTVGNGVSSSPAISSDGTIYVGSWDNKLYAVGANGTQKWAFDTGSSIFSSSPSIGADGTIYIGSYSNMLHAVYSNGGPLADTDWPKFRRNLRNTGSYGDLFVDSQLEFRFIASGQSISKPFSLSNTSTKDILVTGCTFDNPEFVLETQLPLTIAAGSKAQLSARIQPSCSKCYTCKGSVIYTLNSATQTKLLDLSTGIFVEDNSERAYAAHQAVDAYNNCLAKDPGSVATRNNLGVLYRLLSEYDIAEQYLMQALSSSLNARYGYTGIRMNLGVVKSDKSTQSDAFTFYSSAETDISGSASSSSLAPQIYYNQAWEYYRAKSLTQALTAVNKTISHQSANSYLKAKAYILRGSIYYGNNDIANTKKDMESAKTLDPGGPIGRMADENLSAINATGVERDKDKEVPTEYALLTNYPNPFNPSTTIRFQLPARSNVRVLVYDITGREIRTLVDENMDAGSYSVRWDGEDNAGRTVTSGVYIVRMNAGYYTKTQKVVLLR